MNDCVLCLAEPYCHYPHKPCDCAGGRKFMSKKTREEYDERGRADSLKKAKPPLAQPKRIDCEDQNKHREQQYTNKQRRQNNTNPNRMGAGCLYCFTVLHRVVFCVC